MLRLNQPSDGIKEALAEDSSTAGPETDQVKPVLQTPHHGLVAWPGSQVRVTVLDTKAGPPRERMAGLFGMETDFRFTGSEDP